MSAGDSSSPWEDKKMLSNLFFLSSQELFLKMSCTMFLLPNNLGVFTIHTKNTNFKNDKEDQYI